MVNRRSRRPEQSLAWRRPRSGPDRLQSADAGGAAKLAEGPLAIGDRAETHALKPPRRPRRRLADRTGGDQARRNNHVQSVPRSVADREVHASCPCPRATTSRSPAFRPPRRSTVSVATPAGAEDGSGSPAARRLGPSRPRPEKMMPLARPAANPARTRQRCRHSIALEPFWTGPPPKGRSSRTLTGPISAKTFGDDSIPTPRIAPTSSSHGRRRRTRHYSNLPPLYIRPAKQAGIGRIVDETELHKIESTTHSERQKCGPNSQEITTAGSLPIEATGSESDSGHRVHLQSRTSRTNRQSDPGFAMLRHRLSNKSAASSLSQAIDECP